MSALLVSDLDGTLRHRGGDVSAADLAALRSLRAAGVITAIATGRSLYSARGVLPADFPIDYLLFSSGAGAMHWPEQRLLRAHALPAVTVRRVARILVDLGVNFMVHDPIPDNHRFLYHEARPEATDFRERCHIYRRHCRPLDRPPEALSDACQFVAVIPTDGDRVATLREALPGCHVVRTTSPLTGQCTWAEVFPAGVSKSAASAWLCEELGIPADQTYALGNDYNDADLLRWASRAALVSGAPADLLRGLGTELLEPGAGLSEAAAGWQLL